MRAFEVLTKAEFDIRAAAYPRYQLEMALLRWIHLRKLVPISELIDAAGRMEKGLPAPVAAQPWGARFGAARHCSTSSARRSVATSQAPPAASQRRAIGTHRVSRRRRPRRCRLSKPEQKPRGPPLRPPMSSRPRPPG